MNAYRITCLHFGTQWKPVGKSLEIWITFTYSNQWNKYAINQWEYSFEKLIETHFNRVSSGGTKHSPYFLSSTEYAIIGQIK